MNIPIPAGARWYKFDFHSHTPASNDYGKNSPDQAALKQRTPREWLLDYMHAEIDCIAVTDHNTGAWADELKEALEQLRNETPPTPGFRDLWFFPGVEVTASGGQQGIHILVTFPSEQATTNIDRFLGGLNYAGNKTQNTEMIAGVTALEVCKRAVAAGGVAIPSHVDEPCGLFTVLGNGVDQQNFLDQAPVFAVEVWDRTKPKPQVYIDKKKAWTEVVGSDAHHPSGTPGTSFPGSRFT
ncbi:MAG: ABC transporter, partial [Armatimonadetes bacterium]|nr:ABC transporter [Armatimonadota bacterium]